MESLMKDKRTAALLAVLLGGISAHWIYLGRRAFPIFNLIVVMIGFSVDAWFVVLPFVASGIISALLIINTNWHEFNKKYNRDEQS